MCNGQVCGHWGRCGRKERGPGPGSVGWLLGRRENPEYLQIMHPGPKHIFQTAMLYHLYIFSHLIKHNPPQVHNYTVAPLKRRNQAIRTCVQLLTCVILFWYCVLFSSMARFCFLIPEEPIRYLNRIFSAWP